MRANQKLSDDGSLHTTATLPLIGSGFIGSGMGDFVLAPPGFIGQETYSWKY